MMETVVAPAAADAAAGMLEGAREDCKRVQKYLARLKEVRFHASCVLLLSSLCAPCTAQSHL